jgi:Ser/Thr protein kinase RdoA (MazF antagonist)
MTQGQSEAAILSAIRIPFELSPAAVTAPLGNGHINQTILVTDGDRHLVAQKINTQVFNKPEDLVHNACLISEHLEEKGGPLKAARHLPGRDGRLLFGPDGDLRVLEYFPGSRSIEVLETSEQAELAAASFASFASQLADFDQSQLRIVIPGFHSPELRWQQFQEALKTDAVGRVQECAREIEIAEACKSLVAHWQKLMQGLPVRVTHNDCKINNMLVHSHSGKAMAIIDLDTCMPGPLLTDFGDLVRTCCSPEPEDSTRLDKVHARSEVYLSLLRGYESGWEGRLSSAERASLFEGGLMMCFIIGLRFLTDFLAGDSYFGVAHSTHNLDRARNQFQLFRSLQAQRSHLEQLP